MKITLIKEKRKISIDVKKTYFFSKVFGLMFRTRETNNLIFEFNNYTGMPFTALFCFFPFLLIWLDETNSVLGCRTVNPFELTIKPKTKYRKVVEIPINDKNSKIIDFFVGKSRKI